MVFDILLSIAEIVTGLGGLYAIYQCMKHLRASVAEEKVDGVWARLTALLAWAAASCLLLVVCAVLGGRSWGVLVLALGGAVLLAGSGGLMAWLRVKTLRARGAREMLPKTGGFVEVRSLRDGRVRGCGEDGNPVFFTPQEIQALVGVRGHVRLLNWASARRSGAQGEVAPLMAFWSVQGDTFVLYADDDVVMA